jgi:seryl-tRNA synthetase
MLHLPSLRQDHEAAKARLAHRNFEAPELLDRALELDDRRKALQSERDQVQAEANATAKQIGKLMGMAKTDPSKAAEAEAAKKAAAEGKGKVQQLEKEVEAVEQQLEELLLQIPNLPHASVPAGKTPEDNAVVREGGVKPDLPEDAEAHWDLADRYKLIDFELGVKLAGSGFPVYIGQGARLQRALIAWFLDRAAEAGYLEHMPSVLVNEASARGTGQLPDKEGQMYGLVDENLYLAPTAEVPLTNIYRDAIVPEADLPVKMCAYTSCFRREAGSYGKDVRGLNRLHQFEKVEIVQVVHPEKSYAVLDEMVAHVESLVQALELPYRILRLCGGDMGFTSALTYDFEVWSGAQKRWLEVSSVSNFETFQANRLKLRFADENNKKHLAHTLNGSALALPRIMAALLENNQLADHKGIVVPEVLRDFMGREAIR